MPVSKGINAPTSRLSGKTVLITGGSGLIGFQIALACAKQGASTIITAASFDRAREYAQKVADASQDKGSVGFELNCSSDEGINKFLETLRERSLRPDALVHCARSIDSLQTVDGSPPWDNWLAEYAVAVAAPYQLATGLLDSFSRSGDGAVVLVSSIYGVTAVNPNLYDDPSLATPIHYSAAKAAVLQLTRELAVRFSPRGVRVNCITYGGVRGRVDADFEKRYSNLCPSGRMLEPGEVGAPAAFLLSADASGITGHNLVVDGGWTAW